MIQRPPFKRGRGNQSGRNVSSGSRWGAAPVQGLSRAAEHHARESAVPCAGRGPLHASDHRDGKGSGRPPARTYTARPVGRYEIIAGERRHQASELASLKDMPVIVREMSDEETVTELVDSNIQREDVLPSERAWAYRMRLEVVKRQGERTDLTSLQNSAKFRRTSRRWCWTRWSICRTPPPCPRPSG